jgi:hypothetical protein
MSAPGSCSSLWGLGRPTVEQNGVDAVVGRLGHLGVEFVLAILHYLEGHLNFRSLTCGLKQYDIFRPEKFRAKGGFAALGFALGQRLLDLDLKRVPLRQPSGP